MCVLWGSDVWVGYEILMSWDDYDDEADDDERGSNEVVDDEEMEEEESVVVIVVVDVVVLLELVWVCLVRGENLLEFALTLFVVKRGSK